MAKIFPVLEPLRQARKSINSLSRFEVRISNDNRNRFALFPFGGITGRNQPKASECLLLRPKWLRGLMKPDEDYALIQIDIKSAEAALAAAFSGDPESLRVYESGVDQYLAFAISTGAAPPDATEETHSAIRDLYKTALLAIQFGVGAQTLSQNLDIPLWQAERIIEGHKRVYATYWAWAKAQIEHARARGYMETGFGWRMTVDDRTPYNLLLDFPQQAGCAEVLRLTCLLAIERGLGPYLAAPLHDALFLYCPADQAEAVASIAEDCFQEAGHIVTDGVITLRLETTVTYCPDRYIDEKGREIWETVQRFLARKLANRIDVAA